MNPKIRYTARTRHNYYIQMREKRLGDDIDDFCVKCKRITNHVIVSFLEHDPAKVRCCSCYNEHYYQHEQPPPPKKKP